MNSDAPLDAIQHAAAEQFSKQSHRYGKGHILENVSDVRAALAEIETLDPQTHLLSGRGLPVLDVAAGAGHTGLLLAELGHTVTLADISDAMLERCREHAAARGLSVVTQQTCAEHLPFPDASFSLLTCRVAAHHFSDVDGFLRETNRVLKPGGWFLLIDGSIDDDRPVAEAWLHRIEKLRDPSHGRFLSPREWRTRCSAAGLQVESAHLHPLKQPDLEWYFETANTPAANRAEVLDLVEHAPPEARDVFHLQRENGKIVWYWPRLTLLARKP
jgi:ubiquinone/menaquinone biosynthesis C-methylase UbiE